MENVSTSRTGAESLSQALEREHREIDNAIKGCADGSVLDSQSKVDLKRAVDELRRHIYVEEELLFPHCARQG